MADRPTPMILIVEDTETCATTLEIAMGSLAGHDVRTAATAEDALVLLADHEASAVITDLHLPGLSGFDLIRQIRERTQNGRPIIVVISGDTDPRTPRRVLDLGADAYFTKPYSPAEVRRTLERLIHAD
jgi:DNA-binding response OmpR family regulator